MLLEKCVAARKLHHAHFYSLEMDYGHKAYLDKLLNQQKNVLLALESLERRTTEVLYEQEKWFAWVRDVQSKEDATRVKEKEMVKLEAALFKRHKEEIEARLKSARQKRPPNVKMLI